MDTNSNQEHPGYKSGHIFIILALVLVQGFLLSQLLHKPPPEPEKIKTLTIASLRLEQVQGKISPFGPGFERELVQILARGTGLRPRWKFYKDWQSCLQAFLQGRTDLLIAPGFYSQSLQAADIQPGPSYEQHEPLLLHYRLRYGLRQSTDLCQFKVLFGEKPVLLETLQAQTQDLQCGPELLFLPTASIKAVLEMLEQNQSRFALADSGSFRFWEPFFTDLRRTHTLPFDIEYRWYWKKENPVLQAVLSDFWQDLQSSPQFKRLTERYWGFLPGKTDYYQIIDLQEAIQNRLPSYQKTILQAAQENKIDPLFLVAMIYQESRFLPSARSRTGVRGLLQLTQSTAQELGVQDRLDPRQSILGGARYLKQLWESLEALEVEGWDRWFLALGAYNQGLSHVHNALALAHKMDINDIYWFLLKDVYPKLSYKKYYSQTPYGYARGYEAVDYVQNIRYYYYLLHGFSILSGPEADQLAPLFKSRPADWPG